MKLTRLLLAFAFLLTGTLAVSARMITTTGTKPSVGNGNSGSPYEIWTAEELRWFVHYENTRHWYPNDYAKLMCDIDLSKICGPDKGSWIPLGVAEESGAVGAFYGNFNGNGHTVSGMYIDGKDTDDTGSRAGFFGLMTAGSVYDFTVEGDIINAYKPEYTGGMVAKIDTKSTAMSKDLSYSICESRVNIWYEQKNGPQATLYLSNRCIGGFCGSSSKTDVSISLDNCVFSGDINFDNASAYSHVGAFFGSIENNRTTTLKYCAAATSLRLPFIEYVTEKHGTVTIDAVNCVNRGPMAYKFETCISNSKLKFTRCLYSDRLYSVLTSDNESQIVDGDSYRCDDMEMFTNGFACYTINTLAWGNYFTQTLGTDKMPFPGSDHKTVYKVKEYTNCGNDDFVYTYSNQSTDITEKRQHTFVPEESLCTVCHNAVNPDYNIAKDEDGYYLVGDTENLKWIWNLVNVTGVTNAKIKLTADIDMDNEAMEPLAKFSGIFDGQGHTIANINISCSGTDKVGLVGELSGSIRNLILSGSVSGSYMKYLGAFAGYAGLGSSISNVRNDCTVKTTGTMNGAITMYVGGITGFTDGSLAYAINNGPVVDASVCTGSLTLFMAGVAAMVSIDNPHHLANNAVVGAQSNIASAGTASAVANMLQSNKCSQSYYTAGISNPGLQCFFSNDHNLSDISVTPVEVGSGRLAWLFSGSKDYSAEDAETCFFGQTIGTDLVPYPFVSESHKGVYNARHYYTCDSYSDYSNSPTDEEPAAHTWNDSHYCSTCCVIDPTYMEQDAVTKAYKISNTEQYNVFVGAVNAADIANKPMRYASASIQGDLVFSSSTPACISQLKGCIHGNGHSITFGSDNSNYSIATNIGEEGIIEYLDVAYPSTNFYPMVGTNLGRIIGCNITRGVPTGESAGLVIDCSGELQNTNNLCGRFTRCLIKMFTVDGANNYRLYNSNAAYNEHAAYTEIALEKGETGELAYTLSHDSGCCEWGQALGTDSDPRIYYGQTPTSDTYVTNLTTYSVENPNGKVEYMNAGMALEAAPGYYKVCRDTESWTTHPSYNFIIDNGDGTYSAEHINLDPTAQHWLPMEVHADKFSFKKINGEGTMATPVYSENEVASLIFPVDMPISNINGKLYIFDGYDNSKILFTSMLDGMDYVPANTPILVKATGGSILNADLTNVLVEPMTEAGYVEEDYNRHLTSYKQESVPTSRTVEDQLYVDYYVMDATGTKATRATAEGVTSASQLQAYFRIPCLSSNESPEKIAIELSDTRSLKTASGMEVDLFSLPYGKVTDGVWSKVAHLTNAENIFYGNDIEEDNYADLTAYDFIYITGKPNQTYYFYFNGSTPKEVVLDGDGEGFVAIPSGECHLRGIRLADGQTISENACAKVYKLLLDEDYKNTGLALSGYGELADEHKGYPLYDATGISCGITLSLSNPNALVIGGPNVRGVTNRILQTEDVMQGFTAESLSITDGYDFCYDFSVLCPAVSYTRSNIANEDAYATAVLPFAVNATEGVYKYVDCDGSKVYFKTPAATIPAYTPIVVDVTSLSEITLSGANLQALLPNGTFNLTDAASSDNSMKYGFVTKRQESVSVTGNAEVSSYNVYGYSTKSHKFVRTTKTFSISPFRAFFLLPKSTQARANGSAAPASAPSALTIVIDGREIGDANGIVDVDFDVDFDRQTKTYNLLGMPVGPGYRGIVIKNNQKIINQ